MVTPINREGLGDRFTNPEYSPPKENDNFSPVRDWRKTIKIPIKFTEDIIEFIESKDYLNTVLFPLQKKFIEDFYSVDALGYPKFDEAVLISGMRSGKTVCAAFVAMYQTMRMLSDNPPEIVSKQLRGDSFTCECIASTSAQANQTIYSKIESLMDYNPYLIKYVEYLQQREEVEKGKGTLFAKFQERIEFKEHNVQILSLHSNSASLSGLTAYAVIIDELSRFDVSDGMVQEKSGKRTADAVYFTASRAAKSLKPFSKILTITSPMYCDDYGMKLLLSAGTLHVGKHAVTINGLRTGTVKIPRIYGMHSSTTEFNPGLTDEDFIKERSQNIESYRRDYEALPPMALSPFFEYPERIEKCVRTVEDPLVLFENTYLENGVNTDDGYVSRMYVGKKVYPVKQDHTSSYYISCDQGESKDSFVLAMARLEEEETTYKNAQGIDNKKKSYKIIVELVEAWIPDKENRVTVSFQNVEEAIQIIGREFNIKKITYDQWNSTESLQRLFAMGFYTEKLGATMEMYDEFKHLIYNGQVSLPRNEKMLTEIRQLNKIKGKFIDHSNSGSKDYSDAVCRVVYCIYEDYIKGAIDGDQMMGQTTEFPTIRSLDQAREMVNNSYAQPIDSPIWGLSGAEDVFGKGVVVRTNVMANIKQKR